MCQSLYGFPGVLVLHFVRYILQQAWQLEILKIMEVELLKNTCSLTYENKINAFI